MYMNQFWKRGWWLKFKTWNHFKKDYSCVSNHIQTCPAVAASILASSWILMLASTANILLFLLHQQYGFHWGCEVSIVPHSCFGMFWMHKQYTGLLQTSLFEYTSFTQNMTFLIQKYVIWKTPVKLDQSKNIHQVIFGGYICEWPVLQGTQAGKAHLNALRCARMKKNPRTKQASVRTETTLMRSDTA